jgi:type IV pilus assembly protein PilA
MGLLDAFGRDALADEKHGHRPAAKKSKTVKEAVPAKAATVAKAAYCTRCGSKLLGSAHYCSHCGHQTINAKAPHASSDDDPAFAAFLSMLVPGLGQIHKGYVGAGIAWFFAVTIGYVFLIIPGLVLQVLCMIHAYHLKPRPGKGKSTAMWVGLGAIVTLFFLGVFAILVSIVIVAINPTKQLQDARNAQRRSDVNTIVNAVMQYTIDHRGSMPAAISATPHYICRTSASDCTGMIDLSQLVGSYLATIPADPSPTQDPQSTRYVISQDTQGRITVRAPYAEGGQVVEVTR